MLEGQQQKLLADSGVNKAHATRISWLCRRKNALCIVRGKLGIRQSEQRRKWRMGKADQLE